MTSSTSSSDAACPSASGHEPPVGRVIGLWLPGGPDEGRRGLLSDPCFLTLLAFVTAVVAIATLRTDVRFAGAPKWFWMEKLCWGPRHDTIVVGDSRVYRGIDPSQFDSRLGLVRSCVNFGFSSATLTPAFVEAAAATLDPNGPRIMVIAVTPASLRAPIRGKDGYIAACEDLGRLRMPLRIARVVEEWELHVAPFAIDRGFGEQVAASRAMSDEYVQHYHADGWVESDRHVADPIAAGVAVVRRDFERAPYSPQVEDDLIRAAEKLVRSGVRLVAFRPWVPPEVAMAEDDAGGIDFGRVRTRLEACGACWIEPSMPNLRSYDGIHLDGPSARAASRALADAIARCKPPTTNGNRPGS